MTSSVYRFDKRPYDLRAAGSVSRIEDRIGDPVLSSMIIRMFGDGRVRSIVQVKVCFPATWVSYYLGELSKVVIFRIL